MRGQCQRFSGRRGRREAGQGLTTAFGPPVVPVFNQVADILRGLLP